MSVDTAAHREAPHSLFFCGLSSPSPSASPGASAAPSPRSPWRPSSGLPALRPLLYYQGSPAHPEFQLHHSWARQRSISSPTHCQCLPVTAQAAVGTRLAYGQPGVPRCTSAQLPLCWPAAGGWLFITRCQTLWFPFVRLLSELWMVSMLSPLNCGIVLPATQQRPHAGIATHI